MSSQFEIMVGNAIQAFQAGNFVSAEAILQKLLKLQPNNLAALQILGLAKATQCEYADAVQYFKKAVKLNPDDPSLQYNLAKTLSASGKEKEALFHHKISTTLMPSNPDAWLNRGKCLAVLNHYEEAMACMEAAIKLRPDYQEAHLNKGALLNEAKCYEDAYLILKKLLEVNSLMPEAWLNFANTLSGLSRFDDAIAAYKEALALKPDLVDAWFSQGGLFFKLRHLDQALNSFKKLLEIQPNHEATLYRVGVIYSQLNKNDLAVEAFEKLYSVSPNYPYLLGALIHSKQSISDWDNFDNLKKAALVAITRGEEVMIPFTALSVIESPERQLSAAKIWMNSHRTKLVPSEISWHQSDLKRKIRVGYYSADFCNHAVSLLMAGVFEKHNREKFEIYAFAYGFRKEDEMRQRLRNAFDKFYVVDEKTDVEIAVISREQGIDIAIDLTGLTQGGRPEIFAERAAPIQINYLGYPGSMGANDYDYILGDSILMPSGSEKFYTENIVYIDPCYQANDPTKVISNKPISRAEFGLPPSSFIYCCFNACFKITPDVFDGWMRILKSVDDSVLWLLNGGDLQVKNLQDQAEIRGVDPSRLIFANKKPVPEYLASYRMADLFLDTCPFNGGTTASDALWSGLPVLTMAGESFAGRMAASLLNAVNIPELITNTQQGYEAMAIDIGLNREKAHELRKRLAVNLTRSPLFDDAQFTINLEKIYLRMVDNHLSEKALSQNAH